jgi:two-component system LytT family response regulator
MEKPIRVLIVDDEPIARRGIRKLLAEHNTDVVGECGNGEQAVAAIRRLHPDLVLLDIEMPELDGFGVIEDVGLEAMPDVLFITAYDEYAVKAFEVHAIDYVLKPIDPVRFHTAYERALQRLQREGSADLKRRMGSVLEQLERGSADAPFARRMVIKEGGRIFFIDTTEINWIEAAGNYVKLHVGNATHMRRDTMTKLLERLDPAEFVRIGRSVIVNVNSIVDLSPLFKGSYVVQLKDGTELISSRRYRDRIVNFLERLD